LATAIVIPMSLAFGYRFICLSGLAIYVVAGLVSAAMSQRATE
jgi:hypothetical protein